MTAADWIIGGLFLVGLALGIGFLVYVVVIVVPRGVTQFRTTHDWESDFLKLLTEAAKDQQRDDATIDQERRDKELLDDLQETLAAANRRLRPWGRRAPSLQVSLTRVSDLCRLKPDVVKRRLGANDRPNLRPTREVIKRLPNQLPQERSVDVPQAVAIRPITDDPQVSNDNVQTHKSPDVGDGSGAQVGFQRYRREVGVALLGGWLLCWVGGVPAADNSKHWSDASTIIFIAGGFACLLGSAAALGVFTAARERWRDRRTR